MATSTRICAVTRRSTPCLALSRMPLQIPKRKRAEAARLSFLLGLPAIALAGFKEMWELYKIHLDGHGWFVLLLGLIVASISAFFAIWWLMRILQQFSTWPFVIYRFMLGIVILVGVATGWLV